MKIVIITIVFSLLIPLHINGQEELDPGSFFPSAVGNVWEYNTSSGLERLEILRDSVDENGNRFLFRFFDYRPDRIIDASFNVFRIHSAVDSITFLVYKLDADSEDTWTVRSEDPSVQRREAMLISIYEGLIFGETRTVKEIKCFDLERGDTVINERAWRVSTQLLVEGIGEYITYGEDGGPTRILSGSIIDGVTLGTITTSVEDEPELLTNFKLYQNYPNPFNPETIIKYKVVKMLL